MRFSVRLWIYRYIYNLTQGIKNKIFLESRCSSASTFRSILHGYPSNHSTITCTYMYVFCPQPNTSLSILSIFVSSVLTYVLYCVLACVCLYVCVCACISGLYLTYIHSFIQCVVMYVLGYLIFLILSCSLFFSLF